MQNMDAMRAEMLTQALPYLQKYRNKTIVIKYGGNAMQSEELKRLVMGDAVLLSMVGIRTVIVHGGGPEITDMLKRVGKTSEFVDGLRVTDKESAEIVQMVLAGKVNKDLVKILQNAGGKAIGISGIDGHLIDAKMRDERLGYVGEITNINIEIVEDILNMGYIPVISTVGFDDEGNVYNINADTAAARIAGMLGAESLIMMTDIRGVLEDKDDPNSLITKIVASEVRQLMNRGIISGGMIPKVECCVEAIRRGVNKVFVVDGRVPHCTLMELFTDEGMGTMFVGG
ncbi:MAG: acetylglutamate kinase [Oscillospiraceae bacterium]|nr:acetylglutamate kinase [Oscillospiraceae bacterium]